MTNSPGLSQPEPAYHGLNFHAALGPLAFMFNAIAVGMRDLGMTLNPQAAHYTLMGIETLSLRMERHCENALKVAEWLEHHPAVDHVTYAGLKSSPYYDRVAKICPKGASSLFTFALKDGYDACVKLIDSVELFSHVANLGDTAFADYSLGLDHASAVDARAAGRGGCGPERCARVHRHRKRG